ncbi:MAG TPA: hypothetical protein VJG49_03470 [Candidatus Nanoarchaeia archaeon]|nr:hypothetical protein [Candidatus Nanoarchaeia archaeon]
MDVERIQKINSLALDLMKKGLASDREDAVRQAELVFKNNDQSSNYAEIREMMEKVKPEQRNTAQGAVDLPQDKIQEILEKNTQFIVKKMREFQEQIASLEKEVNQLRTQINYQKLPTVREIVAQKEQPPKLGEISNATTVPASHPRSGNYKEGDVSIEKFFYMGRK